MYTTNPMRVSSDCQSGEEPACTCNHGGSAGCPVHDDAVHAGYHRRPGTSIEVFWNNAPEPNGPDANLCEGWYWHACFPGCLPDGDSNGPFATSKEAYDDAMGD